MEDYVILDIETTGLDVEKSSIIEVGAILISKGEIRDRYSSFVRIKGELPETTKRLTHITDSMLADAPPIEEVIRQLRKFIQKRSTVAHNGFSFDFRVLEHAGLKLPEKYDSLEFAFFVLPTNPIGHSIDVLAERFSLGVVPHRALPDCELEFEIIQKLQKEWRTKDKKKAAALKFFAERTEWWWSHFLPSKSEGVADISSLVAVHTPYRKEHTEQERLSLGSNSIDLDEVQRFFATGGVAEYSEDRPEQREMARFVAEAFNGKVHAVVEAGTGVGKSKAYLVPAVLFSMRNDIPVVISTHTKALQDQLAFKEIRHVQDLIKPDLHVAIVKGKQNYVCLSKFREFAEDTIGELSQRSLYEHAEEETRFTTRLAFLLLSSWVLETERGDWDELPYWLVERIPKRVKQDVCNLDEMCTRDVCDLFDEQKCFYAKARLRAKDADLVIVNHAILLTGISKMIEQEDPIEPEAVNDEEQNTPYAHPVLADEAKFVVFDEAHHLEDAATSAWELSLSPALLEGLLYQLYDERRGVLKLLESIADTAKDSRLAKLVSSFSDIERELRLDMRTLSDVLDVLVPPDPSSKWAIKLSFAELAQTPERMKPLMDILVNIQERLQQIRRVLTDFSERAESRKVEKSLLIRADLTGRVVSAIGTLTTDNEYYVRYLKRSGPIVEVFASPLSIAEAMKDLVYDNFSSVVLTSATITVDGRFNFFAHRCGTDLIDEERVRYLECPSSFDYSRQAQFFIPKGISYGSGEQEKKRHFEQCLSFLKEAVVAVQGGALILCSSHEQVDQLYEGLADYLADKNIWLLRQSKDQSTTSVVRDFTSDLNSALIGTASLWQGVDVPGPSLRALFIYKIPYRVFTDPLIQARREEIDRTGRDSFASYYEPLAALDLKQGFGRLIRKKTDIGVAVMLDGRLMKRDTLLNSFPPGVKIRTVEPPAIFSALADLVKTIDVKESDALEK